MFQLLQFQKFRDTPSVQFFDITIPGSNARDLVCHTGPAISPNNAKDSSWQFYLHPRQQDNLLALSGGRTFHLVNFKWDHPYHVVRLDANRHILQLPPGTFHRSESDPEGSLVINQAVRTAEATVHSEFRVYNSGKIPKLQRLLASGIRPHYHGFEADDVDADDYAQAA
ncbi:MAG: redox protein [Cyanobacteria bacterium P01_F01_bin.53]